MTPEHPGNVLANANHETGSLCSDLGTASPGGPGIAEQAAEREAALQQWKADRWEACTVWMECYFMLVLWMDSG